MGVYKKKSDIKTSKQTQNYIQLQDVFKYGNNIEKYRQKKKNLKLEQNTLL